ncbi:MAG: hypothetical protein JNL18_17995 [Planctomycetaceae bacterium]|nr:hypothetical protein [Planctomycetaceae bacterium]
MGTQSAKWWERRSNLLPYDGLLQGIEDTCVYASIAGAVNYVAGKKVWMTSSLRDEWNRNGPRQPSFGVASIAVTPYASEIEYIHHHTGDRKIALSIDSIKSVIEEDGLVILSMELGDGLKKRQTRFHMFTLIARTADGFQVWDTNGFQGILTDQEIMGGFEYPDGTTYLPHSDEDTLIMRRK